MCVVPPCDDRQIVAVDDAGFELLCRASGMRNSATATCSRSAMRSVGVAGSLRRRGDAAGLGAAFPQREPHARRAAQRDPDRYQVRFDAPQDRPCEDERKGQPGLQFLFTMRDLPRRLEVAKRRNSRRRRHVLGPCVTC